MEVAPEDAPGCFWTEELELPGNPGGSGGAEGSREQADGGARGCPGLGARRGCGTQSLCPRLRKEGTGTFPGGWKSPWCSGEKFAVGALPAPGGCPCHLVLPPCKLGGGGEEAGGQGVTTAVQPHSMACSVGGMLSCPGKWVLLAPSWSLPRGKVLDWSMPRAHRQEGCGYPRRTPRGGHPGDIVPPSPP